MPNYTAVSTGEDARGLDPTGQSEVQPTSTDAEDLACDLSQRPDRLDHDRLLAYNDHHKLNEVAIMRGEEFNQPPYGEPPAEDSLEQVTATRPDAWVVPMSGSDVTEGAGMPDVGQYPLRREWYNLRGKAFVDAVVKQRRSAVAALTTDARIARTLGDIAERAVRDDAAWVNTRAQELRDRGLLQHPSTDALGETD